MALSARIVLEKTHTLLVSYWADTRSVLIYISWMTMEFGFFIKYQVSMDMWIHIWVFDSIPLINILYQYPAVLYYYYSVADIEVRDGDFSQCSIIVRDCFGYPGVLFFNVKMTIALSRFYNKVGLEVDWDYIESVDCFR